MFLIFNLSFEYFVGVQSPMLFNLSYLLILGKTAYWCESCPLFRQTGLQKMQELYILCLEGVLVSAKRAWKTACAALWRIVSSNKKCASK
jgi:hypothetical protein